MEEDALTLGPDFRQDDVARRGSVRVSTPAVLPSLIKNAPGFPEAFFCLVGPDTGASPVSSDAACRASRAGA